MAFGFVAPPVLHLRQIGAANSYTVVSKPWSVVCGTSQFAPLPWRVREISEEVAMVWTAVYAVTAMVLAPLIYLAAERTGRDTPPRRRRQLWYSILAAVLWPVLALGMAQFAMIFAVRQVMAMPAVVGIRAGIPAS